MNKLAHRELLYSLKGDGRRKKFNVRIKGPYLLNESNAGFRFDEGACACAIVLDGLEEDDITVFGIDGLHALALAVDIDPYLKGMSSKYDFYWITGEPYFD